MSVVCFDLIPEAMEISSIPKTVIGIVLGIFTMIICDILVQNKFNSKKIKQNSIGINKKNIKNKKHIKNKKENNNINSMLKTGIIVSIGLAIHNIPEGLAIGSGFDASIKIGLGLAIAICLHDIPGGISMAVPMKNGGMNKYKILLYVIFSGITTGIGAFIGAIVGTISTSVIAICLSFAARSNVIHSITENYYQNPINYIQEK